MSLLNLVIDVFITENYSEVNSEFYYWLFTFGFGFMATPSGMGLGVIALCLGVIPGGGQGNICDNRIWQAFACVLFQANTQNFN